MQALHIRRCIDSVCVQMVNAQDGLCIKGTARKGKADTSVDSLFQSFQLNPYYNTEMMLYCIQAPNLQYFSFTYIHMQS